MCESPQDYSAKDFVDQFERPRIPVVITGLDDKWPANFKWKYAALDENYNNHKFKVIPNSAPRTGTPVKLVLNPVQSVLCTNWG